MNEIEILSGLYAAWSGERPVNIEKLAGAGSTRRYYRLHGADGTTAVGVAGDDRRENRAFVALSAALGRCGVAVPQVYAVSEDGNYYLQQDLGNESMFDIIKKEGEGSERVRGLVAQAMKSLARLQTLPEDEYHDALGFKPLSVRQIAWDLNYFKYEYLKPAGVEFDEDALEDDFEAFADSLLSVDEDMWGFMYRDCQSRNVMIVDETPYWIDFQGARRGLCLYDAVSFLWQAKAGFSDGFRQEMLDIYLKEYFANIGKGSPDTDLLKEITAHVVLFRTLQVLGAYGFRGLVEKKAHFIESIPGALNNLKQVLSLPVLKIGAELRRVCELLCEDTRFKKRESLGLRIQVFSFSYKKGYPADYSGNGGGFMFDCRGMHNPGRYDEYKPLTGLDAPVREFLEDRGEVQKFTASAMELVSPSVETYLRRGFDSLQIGFGCTGGRHRSVYCADTVGRALAAKYPDAEVVVTHREQGIKKVYNSKSQ